MTVKDEDLLIVPIPALCAILLNLEEKKGSPLTESEVLEVRDKAVCMLVPRSAAQAIEERRGYRDLILEDVWRDWLGFREWYYGQTGST